jgi:hypothetical protein
LSEPLILCDFWISLILWLVQPHPGLSEGEGATVGFFVYTVLFFFPLPYLFPRQQKASGESGQNNGALSAAGIGNFC